MISSLPLLPVGNLGEASNRFTGIEMADHPRPGLGARDSQPRIPPPKFPPERYPLSHLTPLPTPTGSARETPPLSNPNSTTSTTTTSPNSLPATSTTLPPPISTKHHQQPLLSPPQRSPVTSYPRGSEARGQPPAQVPNYQYPVYTSPSPSYASTTVSHSNQESEYNTPRYSAPVASGEGSPAEARRRNSSVSTVQPQNYTSPSYTTSLKRGREEECIGEEGPYTQRYNQTAPQKRARGDSYGEDSTTYTQRYNTASQKRSRGESFSSEEATYTRKYNPPKVQEQPAQPAAAPAPPRTEKRRRDPDKYRIKVRQQPVAARACGFGERDRRVIDPPPIVQLTVHDPTTGEIDKNEMRYPFHVVHCTLWNVEGTADETALVGLEKRLTRRLMGTLVSSPFFGQDEDGEDGCFFCFPDLSCRTHGRYRLKFVLMRLEPADLQPEGYTPILTEVLSDIFTVYTAKEFPGMRPSTQLTKALKRQGCAISVKKGNEKAVAATSSSTGTKDDDDDGSVDDTEERSGPSKKRRKK